MSKRAAGGAASAASRGRDGGPRERTATSDATFARVVAAFAADPRIEPPAPERGAFGSNGLTVGGRIFAMLVRGALVVKLPRERVEELVRSGRGEPFDAGRGRAMKEWVTIRRPDRSWLRLAAEARAFVGPAGPRGGRAG